MLEGTGRRLQLPRNRSDAQASRRGGSSASRFCPEGHQRVGVGAANNISLVTGWPGRCTMNGIDTTWA